MLPAKYMGSTMTCPVYWVGFYFPLTWLEVKGCSLLKLKNLEPRISFMAREGMWGCLKGSVMKSVFNWLSWMFWNGRWTVSFQELVFKNAVPHADSMSAVQLLGDSLKNWDIPDCEIASITVTHRTHPRIIRKLWKSCVDAPYAKRYP